MNTQKQLQYSPVRDIQKAVGTPESTVVDVRDPKPAFIELLGSGLKSITAAVKASGRDKPDIKPLVDAASDMADQFRNASGSLTTAQKDLISQDFYKWAYKSGYDNSDIDAVVKSQGLNELSEDITKYRKDIANRTEDKTQNQIEQGFKIDPTAENEVQALTAFNDAMNLRVVLDAQTNKYKTVKDSDPDTAAQTLAALAPDLTKMLKTQMNMQITAAGGSANLTRQDIDNFNAQFRQSLIGQGLPEWYATYVTDLAMMPYTRIADAAGADKEKATASIKTAEDNINALMNSQLMNSTIKSSRNGDIPMRLLSNLKGIIGEQGVAAKFDTVSLKDILTYAYKPSTVEEINNSSNTDYMKQALRDPQLFQNIGNNADESVKETLTAFTTKALQSVPEVAQAALAQGSTEANTAKLVNSLPVTNLKNGVAKTTTINNNRRALPGILQAQAADEINKFGDDKMVSVDNNGRASVTDLKGQPQKVSDVTEERFLRNTEKSISKLSQQTGYTVEKVADMHNKASAAALGVTEGEDYEGSKDQKEWESMTVEEQNDMLMGRTARKTPVVKPTKTQEEAGAKEPEPIEDDTLQMSFATPEARTRELFRR